MSYMPSLAELLELRGVQPFQTPAIGPPNLPQPVEPNFMDPVPQPAAQLPEPSGLGRALEGLGLSLAQNPVQYRPRRGESDFERVLGSVLEGMAGGYGQATARSVGRREQTNTELRRAAAEANRRNIEATAAARRLREERTYKSAEAKREAAEKEKAALEKEQRENAENDRRALRDENLLRGRQTGDGEEAPPMSAAAIEMAARRYLSDGTLPPMGMGKRAASMRVAIIERAAEIDPNADIAGSAADFAADRASLAAMQKMSDGARAYSNTAHKNAEVLLRAMEKIPDTGSALLNRPLRSIDRKALGSSDLAAYETALRTVIPEFARLLNNPNMTGVLSDNARKEIEDMANGAYSLNQMRAVIATLEQDAANRTKSYGDQLAEIRSRRGRRRSSPDPLGIRGGPSRAASGSDPLGVR